MAPSVRTLAILAAGILVGGNVAVEAADVRRAVAVMFPSELGVARGLDVGGTVIFTQKIESEVEVDIKITGLPASGMHAFHVHQSGDATDTLTLNTLGTHFMPICSEKPVAGAGGLDAALGGIARQVATSTCEDDQIHGYPPAIRRQPGDMGNLTVDAQGSATELKIIGQGNYVLTFISFYTTWCLIYTM
jgi:Cu/Zn superoxide dismutase